MLNENNFNISNKNNGSFLNRKKYLKILNKNLNLINDKFVKKNQNNFEENVTSIVPRMLLIHKKIYNQLIELILIKYETDKISFESWSYLAKFYIQKKNYF